MRRGTLKARQFPELSGERWHTKMPAPCGKCGQVFLLKPTEDLPPHACGRRIARMAP